MYPSTEPKAATIIDRMMTRLSRPESWTKGCSARDRDNLPCDYASPTATCWCLYGALDVEMANIVDVSSRNEVAETVCDLLVAVARLDRPALDGLAQFNDDRTTTHQDVIELLTRARDQAGSNPARNA